MNRTDRLFAILVQLQRRSPLRAQDLAATFEVSLRTIYRDMTALSESGIPLIALPRKGYALPANFSLPPLMFTVDEASALFLGAEMLKEHTTGRLSSQAELALAKIAAILPLPTRQSAERLTEVIHIFNPSSRFDLDDPHLSLLQKAIIERRRIFLRYHSYSQNETTEREVEPHVLSYSNGIWYVEGYCRWRQAMRSFRLDRIEQLDLLSTHFQPSIPDQPSQILLDICIRVAPESLRWIRERQHYAFVREEKVDATDGSSLMFYAPETISEMLPWLLSWGTSVEVLSPLELRMIIRDVARTLLDRLT